jgi:hypothetical protein
MYPWGSHIFERYPVSQDPGQKVIAVVGWKGGWIRVWEAVRAINVQPGGSRVRASAQVLMSFPASSLGAAIAGGTKDNGLGLGLGL